MTVAEIAQETKISQRILDALEDGRFHVLPAKVFSSNFVRQYARMIGENEDELVAEFEVAWEKFQVASGSHPIELKAEVPKPVIRWYFWLPILLGVIFFASVGWLIFEGPKRPSEMSLDTPRHGAASSPRPERSPTNRPSPTVPAPPEAEGAGENGELVRVRIQVVPGEECWVHFRDHEGRTGEQLLRGGEVSQLELMGPAMLTVGNAGAVSLDVGGIRYENLGRPGQVIHTEVGPAGLVRRGVKVNE